MKDKKSATLTLKQKRQKVKDFRPIDDVFFEVLADNNEDYTGSLSIRYVMTELT